MQKGTDIMTQQIKKGRSPPLRVKHYTYSKFYQILKEKR